MSETPTVKEEQIESVFDPKTEADKDVIELFRVAERLGKRHKNELPYLKVFSMVAASALAVNKKEGTLDEQMLMDEVRRITDEFWQGGVSSDGDTRSRP